MPKMRREDETRGWRFTGKTGSDVCLGRVGGRPHNLVERPQINNIPSFYYAKKYSAEIPLCPAQEISRFAKEKSKNPFET